MTDYSELVKALRWCSVDECVSCTGCPMNEETHGTGCFNIMHQRAAAAIEDLQADQKKTVTQIFGEEQMTWEGRCKDLMYQIADLQAQLPKRGEWIIHPEVKNIYGGVYIECPFCGEKYVVQNVSDEKFCRNCGADMRKMEVQDENR